VRLGEVRDTLLENCENIQNERPQDAVIIPAPPAARPKMIWLIERYVVQPFADMSLGELDRFALQKHLNEIAGRFSKSVVLKFRTFMKAILDEATEQDFIGKNPARKLEIPTTREPCHRAPSQAEIRELLSVLSERGHLILHMFSVLGLRPGELFALRRNDWEASGELRIDEAVSDAMRGDERIVTPKTEASVARVWLPHSIRNELDFWMRNMKDQRPEAFLFPSRRGTPMSPNNFRARHLKPAAELALKSMRRSGRHIPEGFLEGIDHRALRRTCATRMQMCGSLKDIQAHLRHASPDVTAGVYMQPVQESVRAAVEALDADLMGTPARLKVN
jgi:integrase